MARADKLRRQAELLRRAASHPTEGSKETDRILLAMAERLEHKAAEDEAKAGLDAAASSATKLETLSARDRSGGRR
jgi:hypothetical protein